MSFSARAAAWRVEPASLAWLVAFERMLVRWRLALWFSVVVLEGFATTSAMASDMSMFAGKGADILRANLSAVYGDSENQGGPLQLAVSWLILLGRSDGYISVFTVAGLNVGLLCMALLACRTQLLTSRRSPRREVVVAALVAIWLLPSSGFWSGHPVEIVIPILWIGSALAARRGRRLTVGVLIGAASAVAPWGILALPIVLLLPTRRGALCAAVVGTLVSAGVYLPFVLTGNFRLFHHRWPIYYGSLVHLLAPSVGYFGWDLRVLQAVVAMGACAFVAHRCRTIDALWLAPFAATLLRVLTDPVLGSYYWQPLAATAIAGVALGAPQIKRPAAWVAVVALAYLPLIATSEGSMWLRLGVLNLGAVGVLTVNSTKNVEKRGL